MRRDAGPAPASWSPPAVQALAQTGRGLNAGAAVVAQRATAARLNRTGLPDQLKNGIEGLSGVSLDDVQVHRNSAEPAQLNAHAFAQGADIHVAPGQERHLPHEAWHVVQQKQGRVRPTRQLRAPAAAPPAASHAPAQRAILVHGQDDEFDPKYIAAAEAVASDLDDAVATAVGIVQDNPMLAGVADQDGYLKLWATTFAEFTSTGQLPAFFYARYGYAVESLATLIMKSKTYALVKVSNQVAMGATRPDFVVRAGSTDVAWLDITSSASQGHVLSKQHSGWKTRPYVAEILYDPPDPSTFAKNPKLSDKQREVLRKANDAQLKAQADYQRGADALAVVIDNALGQKLAEKGSGLSKIDTRTTVTAALRPLLENVTDAAFTENLAGQVLRCMGEVKVGDSIHSGASWAGAFKGQGVMQGWELIRRYGIALDPAQADTESSEGVSEELSGSGSGSGSSSEGMTEELSGSSVSSGGSVSSGDSVSSGGMVDEATSKDEMTDEESTSDS